MRSTGYLMIFGNYSELTVLHPPPYFEVDQSVNGAHQGYGIETADEARNDPEAITERHHQA